MFAMQLALTLFACGGEAPAPTPSPAPAEEPHPSPEPAPAAAPEALPPLEVTLEDNQRTCLGDADCTVIELDCCDCGARVAANKSSSEAVTKKHKRSAEQCAGQECTGECAAATAKCVEFKCALAE